MVPTLELARFKWRESNAWIRVAANATQNVTSLSRLAEIGYSEAWAGMNAFVVRYEDGNGDSYEWPRVAVLGKRSRVLAGRMVAYVLWNLQTSSGTEVKPFDLNGWLNQQENGACLEDLFVAVTGELDECEEGLLERSIALLGQHCIVVADAHIALRPSWRSVIRLPPHHSWDTEWVWAPRVVLYVLLEAALNRGLVCFDVVDVRRCIEGRYSELAVAFADGEDRAVLAVEKVLQKLSVRMDLALAEAFILTFHADSDINMQEIHLGVTRLKDAIAREDVTILVNMVWTGKKLFSVSLIASAPFA